MARGCNLYLWGWFFTYDVTNFVTNKWLSIRLMRMISLRSKTRSTSYVHTSLQSSIHQSDCHPPLLNPTPLPSPFLFLMSFTRFLSLCLMCHPLSLSHVSHPLPLSVSHVYTIIHIPIYPSIHLSNSLKHPPLSYPMLHPPFFFSSSICSLSYKCARSTHMHQNIRKQTYKNKYLYSKAPREWLCDHNRQ